MRPRLRTLSVLALVALLRCSTTPEPGTGILDLVPPSDVDAAGGGGATDIAPEVDTPDIEADTPDTPDAPEATGEDTPDAPDVPPDPCFPSCDDGVACTTEACVDGACVYEIAESACLIGVNCHAAGESPPANPCLVCDPVVDSQAWTPADAPCDDQDGCTHSEHCAAGACVAEPVVCEDADPCTVETCEGSACAVTSFSEGAECQDGDPCTLDDQCDNLGGCAGSPMPCDDQLDCTEDSCEAGECLFAVLPVTCLIDGACVAIGTFAPGNDCLWCDPTQDPLAWSFREGPCADESQCTIDETCVAGQCFAQNLICVCEADADCDDQDACNGVETCDTSSPIPFLWSCEPGEPVECDAGAAGVCQAIACDAETGDCVLAPGDDGEPCDDGSTCTQADSCVAGECLGKALSCDDGNPCTDDSCDPGAGCAIVLNAEPCDDGDPCTQGDHCDGGACGGENTCGCASAADCPEVNACDGQYECQASGDCLLLEPEPCDTSGDNPCQTTACDPDTQACETAVAPSGTPCSDGDPCTLVDACEGAGDSADCAGSSPDPCDDGDACTLDSCEAPGGCINAPASGIPCSDGEVCTDGDTCLAGECTAGAVVCDCTSDADCPDPDADLCTGVEVCDQSGSPETWACAHDPTTAVTCTGDTGNPCTELVCDPTSGACGEAPSPDGTSCDDSDPCTWGDGCLAGLCVATTYQCDDDLACTVDACDGVGGCIATVADGACLIEGVCAGQGQASPSSPCLVCDPAQSGDAWSPGGDGCDDGNACTWDDGCAAGACSGTPYDCDDEKDCTFDSCDGLGGCSNDLQADHCLVAGECFDAQEQHPANGCLGCDPTVSVDGWTPAPGPCSDDSACTTGEACDAGACTGGDAVVCDDGNDCTDDACDPASGCTWTPNGVACDDGDDCTSGDLCDGGACAPGESVCECVVDADCADDLNPCTSPAVCEDNACVALPVTCPAPADPCLVAACNLASGDCDALAGNDGAACSDGSECTLGDTCSGGTCGGVALICDDSNPCTDDSCEPASGCVHSNGTFSQSCYEGPAGTLGVGACHTGTRTCAGGELGPCEGQWLPAAQELCDGEDDDCDGFIDESFPTKGDDCDGPDSDKCATGTWECAADGLSMDCQGDVEILELCNGIDDDCDGALDEGCDDDGDGWCDADLQVVGSPAVCSNGPGDCDDGDAEVYPGAPDVPDVGAVDANCDGIDGDPADAVFVSDVCGGDFGDGTAEQPLRRIDAGIALAQSQGASQVLIDASVLANGGFQPYEGGITLTSGVSLYGRYRAHDLSGTCDYAWTRSANNVTRIRKTFDATTSWAWGVQAFELLQPTTLQWLTIGAALEPTGGQWPQTRPGLNVFGVLVRGGNLVIEGCVVQSGIGGDGGKGDDGEPGTPGNDGQDGGDGSASFAGMGGNGGNSACSGSWAAGTGAQGGYGSSWGGYGGNGGGPGGGQGGAGGEPNTCALNLGGGKRNGKNGKNGSAGPHGTHGISATNAAGGLTGDGLWIGEFGTGGGPGGLGSAGGAGGGGGGGKIGLPSDSDGYFSPNRGGGGGGGGGSGGCGGFGGQGGAPAGGSFGVYVFPSPTPTGGGVPVAVVGSTLSSAGGGVGGAGGEKGDGGAGGAKGDGGDGGEFVCEDGKTKEAGDGGNGGKGGKGGNGAEAGGGAGGVSFAIYAAAGAFQPTVSDSTLTGGTGGAGGQHGANKPDGVDGLSGEANFAF